MSMPNIIVNSASQHSPHNRFSNIAGINSASSAQPVDDEDDVQNFEGGNFHAYPPLTLTVEDLIWELNISRPTAYALVKEKDFPSFNIGRRVLVNREKLQEWLDRQCGATSW